MRPAVLLSLAAVLIPFASGEALGQTLHVPKDFATIQAALDEAVDGDTILISAGTYAESVVTKGKSNLLIKAKGKVVIDPPDGLPGLTLDSCTDCTVMKVRVTGATDGIVMQGCTGGDLFKCRVEDVTGNGIALDGCDGVMVEKCTVKDTGDDGIALGPPTNTPSDNCIVLLNKLIGVGEDGIEVNGDGNSIDENRIILPADDGIRTVTVPTATGNTFSLNKVVKPVDHGFRIAGDDNELVANNVVKAGGNGYQLSDGSGHVVWLCKAAKPADDGLFGLDTATGVSVLECKFRKPGANGMDIEGDDALVDGNKSTAAGDNGCVVGGDNGTWTNNVAKGSQSDGFELLGAGNTLDFNTGKGSKDGFDLNDLSGGANTIGPDNNFKTESP